MTNAELLNTLLTRDAPVASFAGDRIGQGTGPRDEEQPSVRFRSVGTDPLPTFNSGHGLIPEDWAVEVWAVDSITRDDLRAAVRACFAAVGTAADRLLGRHGILLQGGGSELEAEGSALYGWQDTFRVFHHS